MNHQIKYIYGNTIIVSQESIDFNEYTWQNETVSDLYLIEKFYDLIFENSVILDIGAQSGSFTLLSKFFPKSKWYSFEPDPINHDILKKNIEINSISNVSLFNIGLSNEVGSSDLKSCKSHRGLNSYGNSITRFSENDFEIFHTQIDTIDNIFLNEKIDLIKIDTEGCEYNILDGGKNVIMKYKPKILLEYYEENLMQFGKNFKNLNELISELNYEIVEFFSDNILIQSKK